MPGYISSLLCKQWWKRNENCFRENRQNIKWLIKRLGLSISLLGQLQHALDTELKYAENFTVLQLHKFWCISRRLIVMLCSNKTQIRTLHTKEWEQTTIRNLHQYTCKTTCIFYLVWKLRNFALNNKSPSSVEFHPIASSVPPLSLWNICHTCECNRKKSWSLKSGDARGNNMI